MNAILKAILKATRPEGITIRERKRRDRLLLLAVLAGWFVVVFELAALIAATVFIAKQSIPIHELLSTVRDLSVFYFAPMLLAVLPFFVLYGHTKSTAARVLTIAVGSVLLPFLSASPVVLFPFLRLLIDVLSGWSFDVWQFAWEPIPQFLGTTAFGVLPALTAFLIISRSEFFRGNRKSDGEVSVPVAASPLPKDRTAASREIEFSYP
jgi:hypothetical protein